MTPVKGHLSPSRSLEDSSAQSDVDCEGTAQEVSEGTVSATGLETIPGLSWLRMWLLSVLAWGTYLRLN